MKHENVALFPGSFDPFTNGHLDLTVRGAQLFGRVVVAVAHNPSKTSLFTPEERVDMIRDSVKKLKNVSVMHFAGLKAVGESVAQPMAYFDNNVNGTLQLLEAMRRAQIKTFVFSSSATVYGDPASVPIREDFPRSAQGPVGEPVAAGAVSNDPG